MPLYQRKGSPFWWYSFGIDGERFRGSTGETSKRKAAQVEADEVHAVQHNKVPKDRWSVKHCLGMYWKEHARHSKSSSATLIKLDALERILGAKTPVMNITNATLMNYRAKRRGEGLQPHSVNRDFAYLKAALGHAQQMHGQQIPPLAWRNLKAKEPPGRIRYLSRDEYDRLLDACEDDALRLIVKFAVGTGLRKTNIVELDWNDVDLSSGLLSVMVKGGKRHTIALPSHIRAALSTLKHRNGLVFDSWNLRRKWERAVKAAELHDFRFHDLRHTCATWMRMAGVDIADICDALGHSSVTVTMRYAHIEPEEHISAFDRISERVWSQTRAQSVKSTEKKA